MTDVALLATLCDWSKRVTEALRDLPSEQVPYQDDPLTTTLIEAHADLARLLDRRIADEHDQLASALLEAEQAVAKAEDALDAANRATDNAAATYHPRNVITRLCEIADWRQEELGAATERRDAAQAALAAFDAAVSQ